MIRIDVKGRVFVGDRRVNRIDGKSVPYIVLKTIAKHEGRDLLFNSPYELVAFLRKYVSTSSVINFVVNLLGKECPEPLRIVNALANPRYGDGGVERTLLPDGLRNAYARLRDILLQEVDVDVNVKTDIIYEKADFPYLTWFGFVRCRGRVEDVDREENKIVVSCGFAYNVVVRIVPWNAMELVDTAFFFKSLNNDNVFAKIANVLPNPSNDLFVRKDELGYVEYDERYVLPSYFVSIFDGGVVGRSFVAPVVSTNGIEWVETKVAKVTLGDDRVILHYRHGGYSGRVVLLPTYRSIMYHNAVAKFMERNRGTELMRHVEDRAMRLTDRLSRLAEFLNTVLTTIKLITA